MSKQYVLVTAISHFRMRYCIPVDELRAENPDATDEEFNAIEWAEDCVTLESVKEFSQQHISEDIIDTRIISEEEMLRQFDEDNSYLSTWSRQKKIEYVNDWPSNLD